MQNGNSKGLRNYSLNPHFSHIYIERAAADFALTRDVLRRFPRARVIEIDNYKAIFNRGRQDWRLQKRSPKLILAVKPDGFLYPATAVLPTFGESHSYYNSLMLNCLYDCDYCYLQGMYPSANVVIFVNLEDFYAATDAALAKHALSLAISYDTDLLAFEGIIPLCRKWIEFASTRPGLTIEIRTKSANFASIKDMLPGKGVILAWTLSPPSVVERYESRTASLPSRLEAIRDALELGWKVRLCFDPVLAVPGWRDLYAELIESVFSEIPKAKLHDVCTGSFRMNSAYLSDLQRRRNDSEIVFHPMLRDGEGTMHYPPGLRGEIDAHLLATLTQHLPRERIFTIS